MDPPVSAVKQVEAMPRELFFYHCIDGICKSKAYAHLVTYGIEYLTEGQKDELKHNLAELGVICEEKDLEEVASTIYSRATRLL